MIANSPKNLKIAITGGIASGKSTVSSIISRFGYKVFSADEIYSELLEDESIAKKCCEIVGIAPKIVDGKATFDKRSAAPIVYSDKEKRLALDNYTHALVYKRIDELFAENGGTVFFEVPLLFESGREGDFDDVIVVVRDRDSRIEGAKDRDGKNRFEIEKIISSQFDYSDPRIHNYTVIINDGDVKSLSEKVVKVLGRYGETR